MPEKYLADLRSRANSQQYSSIYEDQSPKIEDIERSDGKKSAQGQEGPRDPGPRGTRAAEAPALAQGLLQESWERARLRCEQPGA